MTTRADPYKAITVRPSDGGQLITRASLDTAGLLNYSIKRDWRRDLDTEMRREGHDYFYPNTTKAIGGQPFPGQIILDSLTNVVGTALAVRSEGHHYENGETIIISGANEAGYNGQFVIFNVTPTSFQFTVPIGTPSPGTGATLSAAPLETINLIYLARRPNGQTAVLAGSQRRLYRYFSLEDGDYFEGDNTPKEYFELTLALEPNGPYFQDNPGEWIVIGWGFSTLGKRWEAVNINGWTVLNNAIDLPMTYRVEEMEVVPIYELREQGILSVGTIAEYNGILMLGDITEIEPGELPSVFGFLGDIDGDEALAVQPVNTVTVLTGFFNPSHVGKWIVYANGQMAPITGYGGNPIHVTVGGPALGLIQPTHFKLRTKASQGGSLFSGLITASQPTGTPNVTSSAPFFNAGMVGKTLRYSNGFQRTIVTFNNASQVDLAGPNPGGSILGLPFWIIDATSYQVTATSAIFTPDMVGKHIIWDNGAARKIVSWLGGTLVTVDLDIPVASDFIGIENTTSYTREITLANMAVDKLVGLSTRIQFRLIWSMVDQPRRFGATVPGAMTANGFTLTLAYPVKSFEIGQDIRVVGAGVNGGDLLATIVYISGGGKILQLSDVATTTVTDALVQQQDSLGSIVGFQDLQDDTSAIIKMLDLQQTLVIYKDTSIFLCQFTGNVDAPFQFQRVKVQGAKTLFYRNTLIAVNTEYHLYAARNSFQRFDLTKRYPTEIPITDLLKDLFHDQASLDRTEEIFSCDNQVTNEIWIVRPSATSDKAICLDYNYDTLSTTSTDITAAATVKRPMVEGIVGTAQDWFVMGNAQGTVMLYGRTDANQNLLGWSGNNDIYFRRNQNPYLATKNPYDSLLISGFAGFGQAFDEKDLTEYVLYLASQSPNTTLLWQLAGTRNVDEVPTLLASLTLTNPQVRNLIPVFFRQNYFKDMLTVSGIDNPIRITSKTWRVSIVGSRSAIRKA